LLKKMALGANCQSGGSRFGPIEAGP
jgi:hypothetical protein